MKLMVVDDALFMRNVIRKMVENGGHEVISEASNVKDAVINYKSLSEKPDVVLMDITMPDTDGIEGVKLLKELNPDIKIIMCSAMGQQGMVLDAIKAGAKDFLVKPIDEQRLIDALDKIVR